MTTYYRSEPTVVEFVVEASCLEGYDNSQNVNNSMILLVVEASCLEGYDNS